MRAHVVVQDRTVWLLGGGPLLCVLSVSGAVRKRRSPEPTGHLKTDAGDTMGGNGGAAGEAAALAEEEKKNDTRTTDKTSGVATTTDRRGQAAKLQQ